MKRDPLLMPDELRQRFETERSDLDLTAVGLRSLGGVIYSNFKTRIAARNWLNEHGEPKR